MPKTLYKVLHIPSGKNVAYIPYWNSRNIQSFYGKYHRSININSVITAKTDADEGGGGIFGIKLVSYNKRQLKALLGYFSYIGCKWSDVLKSGGYEDNEWFYFKTKTLFEYEIVKTTEESMINGD